MKRDASLYVHAELKMPGDPNWHHYGHYEPLNFDGIREVLEGIAQWKGQSLPDDTTAVTRLSFGQSEPRAVSYIGEVRREDLKPLQEFLLRAKPGVVFAIERWLGGAFGVPCGELPWEDTVGAWFFAGTWATPYIRTRGVEDVRWIFWFEGHSQHGGLPLAPNWIPCGSR